MGAGKFRQPQSSADVEYTGLAVMGKAEEPVPPTSEELEHAPLFTLITTYLSYLILICVGYVNDFILVLSNRYPSSSKNVRERKRLRRYRDMQPLILGSIPFIIDTCTLVLKMPSIGP
jgi:hypothetical protein